LNTLVTEETEHGDLPVDVYHKLADDRILFLSDIIDDKIATDIIATLLLKDAEDSESKITLFINSEGGDIRNILMIYDMMQIIQAPIETVCIGSAMDESAIILAAGTPGMRFATKNSMISINQLTHDWANFSDLTDAKIALDQGLSDNKKMMDILAKCTKKTLKEVSTDFDRRVFFTCNQAIKYGLIDKMVVPNK
jgi:ATP-dependent Clp protease protease subunit